MVSADAPARPSAPGDPKTLQDVWVVEVVDADDARAEELETAFRISIGCELDSPQATDVGINRNEPRPQNSPNKFGPQTFFRSHARDFHP